MVIPSAATFCYVQACLRGYLKVIDWKKFAEINNLTPEEFQRQILTVAACIGATLIDQGVTGDADTLKFTCSDNVGKIGVFVRRLDT